MPHILLETTADLAENANIPDILAALAERLAQFDTIDSKTIKAYHLLRSNWHMGEGAPEGFAHCSVSILAGRDLELRKAVADGMYQVVREQFQTSLDEGLVSLTLEVREMDRETYRKSL